MIIQITISPSFTSLSFKEWDWKWESLSDWKSKWKCQR